MKTRILVIDDDVHISELLKLYLEKEDYEVEVAHDGGEGLEKFKSFEPKLVLLDIMLPVMDGWQVCREIRRINNTPIIMLTAKGETFDKVLGLELGADDYIVKPFEPKELIARVKAILRRTNVNEDTVKQYSYNNLTVNISDYTVVYYGKELDMPPKEIELLFFLASHPNKVFTREQLLEQVWALNISGIRAPLMCTLSASVKRCRFPKAGA